MFELDTFVGFAECFRENGEGKGKFQFTFNWILINLVDFLIIMIVDTCGNFNEGLVEKESRNV